MKEQAAVKHLLIDQVVSSMIRCLNGIYLNMIMTDFEMASTVALIVAYTLAARHDVVHCPVAETVSAGTQV
jgi:hypothetical protein